MNDATRNLNPSLGDLRSLQRSLDSNPSIKSYLDEHEKNTRSNHSNDGRSFQKEIETTCAGYANRGIAQLRKVDPPNRVIGSGADRRVLFLKNPFLDFVGTWTKRNGRALFIEAKSTSTHRLPFNRSGGLTTEQVSTIKTWRIAGAAVAVLWRFDGRVVFFLPEDLVEAERAGAKSLVFEEGRPVCQGPGNILWDFLPVLDLALFPPRPAIDAT